MANHNIYTDMTKNLGGLYNSYVITSSWPRIGKLDLTIITDPSYASAVNSSHTVLPTRTFEASRVQAPDYVLSKLGSPIWYPTMLYDGQHSKGEHSPSLVLEYSDSNLANQIHLLAYLYLLVFLAGVSR